MKSGSVLLDHLATLPGRISPVDESQKRAINACKAYLTPECMDLSFASDQEKKSFKNQAESQEMSEMTSTEGVNLNEQYEEKYSRYLYEKSFDQGTELAGVT